MDVAIVRWPREASKRAELENERLPRLLLVEAVVEPPVVTDFLEDWVRIPADRSEVRARIEALILRAQRDSALSPTINATGLVQFRGEVIQFPPIEARLIESLIETFGNVVSPTVLMNKSWPDDPPSRNTLDVHMSRVRRRLVGTNLVVRTVRSRGYALEAHEPVET